MQVESVCKIFLFDFKIAEESPENAYRMLESLFAIISRLGTSDDLTKHKRQPLKPNLLIFILPKENERI